MAQLNRAIPSGSVITALSEYTFSDDAAQKLAKEYSAQVQNLSSIEEVVASVGRRCYAVVPIESFTAGTVKKHMGLLLQSGGNICAEVNVSVDMYPGGYSPDALRTAKHAWSYPKGIEQCDKFLKQHQLQGFSADVRSTADAAQKVAAMQSPEHIALASKRALLAHKLHLLSEEPVGDMPGSGTQMYVVHQDESLGSRYHALTVVPENQPGVLARILRVIADAQMDLRSLQSYPVGQDQYGFFMEMTDTESNGGAKHVQELLKSMPIVREVRSMGSWDHAFDVGNLDQEVDLRNPKRVINEPMPGTELLLRLIPQNHPGVLADILDIIAHARMDLSSLHSYPLRRKRYGFDMRMRNLGDRTNLHWLAQTLAYSDDVGHVEWCLPKAA